jgi:predicted lipoprotein with Yx(FWY)xxD motif
MLNKSKPIITAALLAVGSSVMGAAFMMGSTPASAQTLAQAMTVKEADITHKTDLIAIAKVRVNGRMESILTDKAGLSLYTFELDSVNVSKCSGPCLAEWPSLHVPTGEPVSAPFGTIQGNDGQPQLTLNGLPLYYYDGDKKPGDAFGQYPSWDAVEVK